jgi:hypothetical protein
VEQALWPQLANDIFGPDLIKVPTSHLQGLGASATGTLFESVTIQTFEDHVIGI